MAVTGPTLSSLPSSQLPPKLSLSHTQFPHACVVKLPPLNSIVIVFSSSTNTDSVLRRHSPALTCCSRQHSASRAIQPDKYASPALTRWR